MSIVLFSGHALVAVMVVLIAAAGGRRLATAMRQPPVVGELLVAVAAGPAIVVLAGPGAVDLLLPDDVRAGVDLVGQAGLMLFVTGLTRALTRSPARPSIRATVWVTAGTLVPGLLAGGVLAAWVITGSGPEIRGSAPLPALTLFLMIALSVTAVPVLARFLAERRAGDSTAGVLALTCAVVLDGVCWVLLAAALTLNARTVRVLIATTAVLGAALVITMLGRRVLRHVASPRHPTVAAGVLGVATLTAGLSAHALGVPAVLGAALVGLALPAGNGWTRPIQSVTTFGARLLPVFFMMVGLTVLTGPLPSLSWITVVLTVILGFASKIGGGYLGARLAGQPHPVAIRVGILLNTRGITELIVLQIGYQVAILTPPLYLALLVMALTSTAATHPLTLLADRLTPRTPQAAR